MDAQQSVFSKAHSQRDKDQQGRDRQAVQKTAHQGTQGDHAADQQQGLRHSTVKPPDKRRSGQAGSGLGYCLHYNTGRRSFSLKKDGQEVKTSLRFSQHPVQKSALPAQRAGRARKAKAAEKAFLTSWRKWTASAYSFSSRSRSMIKTVTPPSSTFTGTEGMATAYWLPVGMVTLE